MASTQMELMQKGDNSIYASLASELTNFTYHMTTKTRKENISRIMDYFKPYLDNDPVERRVKTGGTKSKPVYEVRKIVESEYEPIKDYIMEQLDKPKNQALNIQFIQILTVLDGAIAKLRIESKRKEMMTKEEQDIRAVLRTHSRDMNNELNISESMADIEYIVNGTIENEEVPDLDETRKSVKEELVTQTYREREGEIKEEQVKARGYGKFKGKEKEMTEMNKERIEKIKEIIKELSSNRKKLLDDLRRPNLKEETRDRIRDDIKNIEKAIVDNEVQLKNLGAQVDKKFFDPSVKKDAEFLRLLDEQAREDEKVAVASAGGGGEEPKEPKKVVFNEGELAEQVEGELKEGIKNKKNDMSSTAKKELAETAEIIDRPELKKQARAMFIEKTENEPGNPHYAKGDYSTRKKVIPKSNALSKLQQVLNRKKMIGNTDKKIPSFNGLAKLNQLRKRNINA
jgi:hypothetical protein